MKFIHISFRLFFLAIAVTLMSGCTASYKQDFLKAQTAMNSQKRVLIVTPNNGTYGENYYETSGNDVAQILVRELKKYTTKTEVIPTHISIENIEDEKLQEYDYIFIPEILHWEDRLTGWSFRPDRIEVRFDIYDNKRNMVNTVNIKGKSANVVWVSKAPKSLLPKPIRRFLKELFE